MIRVVVRQATESDVAAINAIYNEYIVDSHVSFDTEPWTDDQRFRWFQNRMSDGYPVLVAERNGEIVGTSWSGPWRDKAAYRRSVETTVVLAPGASGEGIGTTLLSGLVDVLGTEGFVTAIALIALPNDASIALHRKIGYSEVGVLHSVGFKGDRLHDTMIMEKSLH